MSVRRPGALPSRIVRDGATETPVFEQTGHRLRAGRTRRTSVRSTAAAGSATFELAIGEDWPSGAYRVTLTAEGRDGSADRLPPSLHRQPTARQEARPHPAGRGNRHLARLQHLGRLQRLSGHHRPGPRPVCDAWSRRSGHGAAASSCCRRTHRACRSKSRCRRRPCRAIRTWNGRWRPATRKKYASAGWASYDSHFFRWAERAGYAVDLASQHDLHFTPEILTGYDCVVFVGHDEYWTWEMRDAVDSYVEQGGHAARFAGNFMWQTRLEDEGRRQVCYKYQARAEDPAYRSGDVTRATNSWDAPEIGRPGVENLRAQLLQGRLCRLGRLHAARRARLSDLSARALGVRRHRPVLRRPARRRQPHLRLRGGRARLRDPQRPALSDRHQRRAGRARNPGPRHGQPGRGRPTSLCRGPVLRRRGRALHRRDAATATPATRIWKRSATRTA